ncbi:MAG: mannose-1-phosphate guanylyltransferase/mannose-6-phosphate isomerase, partial [Alphaproteobacteria bacterium]
ADRLLAEMRRLAPEVVLACERATAAARRDLSFIRLDAAAFGDSPSISIDYTVMEKPAGRPW